MRRIRAKFDSACMYGDPSKCQGILKGQEIMWEPGKGAWHTQCGPTGVDSKADAEYMQGMREAKEIREVRQLFGEAAALDLEIRFDELAGDR